MLGIGTTACGGSGEDQGSGERRGTVSVDFMYSGDLDRMEAFRLLIDEFNETAGAEAGVKIKGIPKTGNLDVVLNQQLPSNSGADVVVLADRTYKKYTRYLDDMTEHIDPEVLDGIYENTRSRYRYNMQDTTSNSDDPLMVMPIYGDVMVLYYNRTAMEKTGVICISVDEQDLDAFNAGTLADLRGKTKADYGIDFQVPAKGFYRSISPFVPRENEINGSSWSRPGTGEKLVFNDRIAMNWDEVEDLGMICTKKWNPDSATQYGYLTEWWFNYGWSVGGNCLEDLSGKGDWTFALAADNPNYIVGEGKTYTGIYTGTLYQAGETLDVKDIVDASPGDTISYETDSATYFRYTVNGQTAAYHDFSAELGNGTLQELPKIREAFSRFCYLAAVGGLDVAPTMEAIGNTDNMSYFTSGNMAMLVEQTYWTASVNKNLDGEWGIAPLPQYKVYTDPEDPECDTVECRGKLSNFSISYCLGINAKSEVKDAAYVFVSWVASEGQRFLAQKGYPSVREADAEVMLENYAMPNPGVVVDCLRTARAGDWWYMPDETWIECWATPLNHQVRQGKMLLDEFLYRYIEQSNEILKTYKQ